MFLGHRLLSSIPNRVCPPALPALSPRLLHPSTQGCFAIPCGQHESTLSEDEAGNECWKGLCFVF